jgi:hypothetical protein
MVYLITAFEEAGSGGMDDVHHNTDTANYLFCG